MTRSTAAVASTGKDQNGWLVGGLSGGDRASFTGDWLKRAAAREGRHLRE